MNLNGKTINPGDLRTQITFKSRTVTTDAGGFQSTNYTEIATVWCRWTNAFGNEVWTANAQGAVEPATILVRYRSDVDATCVVVKGTTTYEIVGSPDNIQDRNEWMEIKLKRLVAN